MRGNRPKPVWGIVFKDGTMWITTKTRANARRDLAHCKAYSPAGSIGMRIVKYIPTNCSVNSFWMSKWRT